LSLKSAVVVRMNLCTHCTVINAAWSHRHQINSHVSRIWWMTTTVVQQLALPPTVHKSSQLHQSVHRWNPTCGAWIPSAMSCLASQTQTAWLVTTTMQLLTPPYVHLLQLQISTVALVPGVDRVDMNIKFRTAGFYDIYRTFCTCDSVTCFMWIRHDSSTAQKFCELSTTSDIVFLNTLARGFIGQKKITVSSVLF